MVFGIRMTIYLIAQRYGHRKEYSEFIKLIHDRFFHFCATEGEGLSFGELVWYFDFELVSACKELYCKIKNEAQYNANTVYFWFAAIHSLLLEPMEDIKNIMAASPLFAEIVFDIIDDSNMIYFNYIYYAYSSFVSLDNDEIAVKFQYLLYLRSNFF